MSPAARVLRGRPAYAILGVVVIVALVLGSQHHGSPSSDERITYLESIIKCPSCSIDTIAQSNSPDAVGLRSTVTEMVAGGASDGTIEAYVVKKFGSGEILTPHGGSGAVAVGIPIAAFAVAAIVIAVTLYRRGRGGGIPGDEVAGEDLAIVTAALADRRGTP